MGKGPSQRTGRERGGGARQDGSQAQRIGSQGGVGEPMRRDHGFFAFWCAASRYSNTAMVAWAYSAGTARGNSPFFLPNIFAGAGERLISPLLLLFLQLRGCHSSTAVWLGFLVLFISLSAGCSLDHLGLSVLCCLPFSPCFAKHAHVYMCIGGLVLCACLLTWTLVCFFTLSLCFILCCSLFLMMLLLVTMLGGGR